MTSQWSSRMWPQVSGQTWSLYAQYDSKQFSLFLIYSECRTENHLNILLSKMHGHSELRVTRFQKWSLCQLSWEWRMEEEEEYTRSQDSCSIDSFKCHTNTLINVACLWDGLLDSLDFCVWSQTQRPVYVRPKDPIFMLEIRRLNSAPIHVECVETQTHTLNKRCMFSEFQFLFFKKKKVEI